MNTVYHNDNSVGRGRRYDNSQAFTRMVEKGFTPLDPNGYVNNKTPWECICPEGHVGLYIPKNVFKGSMCFECYQEKKVSQNRMPEEEAKKVMLKVGLTPMEPYKGNNSRWLCRCNNGHELYYTRKHVVKTGCGCRACRLGRPTVKYSQEEVENLFKENGLVVSGKYIKSSEPLSCFCTVCDSEVLIRLDYLKNGYGCPNCMTKRRGFLWKGDCPGFIYLVRFTPSDSESFLKVGIGYSKAKRNRLDTHQEYGAEVIEVIYRNNIQEVRDLEKHLLDKYRSYQYTPAGKGSWGTGTECFYDHTPINLSKYFSGGLLHLF